MPLYEYQCNACAHRFERIVKFSDAPLTICPQCGMETIEQVISAPAVQFKGSGWYVTDYARKSSAPASSATSAKPDSGSDSASSGKESSGADSGASTASSSSSDKAASSAGSSGTSSSGDSASAKSSSSSAPSK